MKRADAVLVASMLQCADDQEGKVCKKHEERYAQRDNESCSPTAVPRLRSVVSTRRADFDKAS